MKNNGTTTIYLVRHAETVWNKCRIVQGQVDSTLNCITETGLRQAEQFADKFRHENIDELYSADLAVTLSTANVISRVNNLTVKTSDKLRGLWWGEYEGKSLDYFKSQNKDILEMYKNMNPEEAWEFKLPGNLESHKDMYGRLESFIEVITEQNCGRTVLVICHSGIIRSFLIKIGWARQHELLPGSVENMGYIRFQSKKAGNKFILEEICGVVKRRSIF